VSRLDFLKKMKDWQKMYETKCPERENDEVQEMQQAV
jgi:hypothetical protein